MRYSRAVRRAVVVAAGWALAACGGSTLLEGPGNPVDGRSDAGPGDTADEAGPGAARFSICFCERDFGIPGYTYDDLVARHGSCAASPCRLQLTERDVERYVVAHEPDGRVEIVLTAEASDGIRRLSPEGRVDDFFGEGPFAVALDGRRLFLGLCYFRGGAAALQFPVMHVEEEDGRVRLRVGDMQGRWAGWTADDPVARARMDPPELRALFDRLGRLAEFP